jgi:hypothetical protein
MARHDEAPLKNRDRLVEFTAPALAMTSIAILRITIKAEAYLNKLPSLAIFTRPRESDCLIFLLALSLLQTCGPRLPLQ